MTPNKDCENERDAILAEFLDQCPEPTPEQISEWVGRYPKFATEISEFAAKLIWLSGPLGDHAKPPEPTPEELEAEYQKSLKLFREIERRVQLRKKALEQFGVQTETLRTSLRQCFFKQDIVHDAHLFIRSSGAALMPLRRSRCRPIHAPFHPRCLTLLRGK